ncbi:MAG: PQQ-binding-like beta-propeller repeat protein, partial [Acidobacteriota bacterium]
MLWINPPGTPTRTTPAAAALLATLLAASPWAAPALEAAEPKEAEPKETESRTASEPEPQAAPAVWQQWRGPQRTGELAAGQAPWPSSLAGLEKVWSAEKLGPSYSGPIVGEKRIFTTETRDESREVVTAYDRHTGEKLWQKQWKGSMKVPFFADANGSWIRSTPAYDGQTLFVGGIQEVLVALDGATGEERWRFNFPARLGTEQPAFGYVCSPLLEDGFLYLEASTSLFKLVAETGEVVWRAEGFSGGDMAGGSFSSPVFAEIGGQRQLVVQSRQELRGVDPESGAV